MRFLELEQGSPEWHAWRASGLGASDSAAVIDQCKFKTPYALWAQKTNRVPAFEGNAYTEAGNAMEPKARASYEIEHDFIEMKPVCVTHPEHDFILASLDGWNAEVGIILEIKYVSEATHEMAKAGKVPDHYYPQCQQQLMCVPEAKELHYYSYREGDCAKVVIKHDKEFQERLLFALVAFWKLIKSDTPPPLSESDAKIIENNAPIQTLCDELVSLSNEPKPTKEQVARMTNLKEQVVKLGGHTKIRCGSVLVSKSITKTGKSSYRLTLSARGVAA